MMTKSEAQEIVSQNVLILDTDGMHELPIGSVEIDVFNVTNDEDENFPVKLLGLIPLFHNKKNNDGLHCSSYFVKCHQKYYYRYNLLMAFKVIEALRVINDYCFEKDSRSLEKSTIHYH
jgi:hypothetical protein